MINVNVTEYKTTPNEYVTYFGRAMLKKGYEFANGDEAFYHFIGKNSCYMMPELLHPDDVEEFLRVVEMLDEGRQCTILRMKNADNQYRLLYIELWHNGAVFSDFKSISFEFCSFMELKDRYVQYIGIVKKYREFMGLLENMFFEYTLATDELNIYQYVNMKSRSVLRCGLDALYQETMASEELGGRCKSEFQVLYEFLKNGMDRFSVSIDADVLLEESDGRLALKGSALYDNGAQVMAVGVITRTESTHVQKSYYLTDNAFDPGTGLWNKRAIHEYAVEKVLEGKGLYLAMVDVDDFKKINDTYGHMFGDKVLSKVSELLRGVVDSRGAVGRFGGDEFMLVIDAVDNEEDLRRIFKTISKNISWAYRDLMDTVPITTSCGIARFPDDGANFEEIFRKADKALYIAKEKGKNRFIIYDEAKHGSIVNEEEDERSVGIKAIVSDSRKASVMSGVVLSLHTHKVSALAEAMEKIRNYFDVDGVTVYYGEDLHRALTAGKYINPIQKLDLIVDESYLELFDMQGVLEECNIQKLKNTHKEAYKLYERQENKEFIQFVAYRNKKPAAVVAFDYFNRAPKIGATDLGLMTIVGRLMAEVACGLE